MANNRAHPLRSDPKVPKNEPPLFAADTPGPTGRVVDRSSRRTAAGGGRGGGNSRGSGNGGGGAGGGRGGRSAPNSPVPTSSSRPSSSSSLGQQQQQNNNNGNGSGRGRGGGRPPVTSKLAKGKVPGQGGRAMKGSKYMTTNNAGQVGVQRGVKRTPTWETGRKAPPRDFSFGDYDVLGQSMHVIHNQFGDASFRVDESELNNSRNINFNNSTSFNSSFDPNNDNFWNESDDDEEDDLEAHKKNNHSSRVVYNQFGDRNAWELSPSPLAATIEGNEEDGDSAGAGGAIGSTNKRKKSPKVTAKKKPNSSKNNNDNIASPTPEKSNKEKAKAMPIPPSSPPLVKQENENENNNNIIDDTFTTKSAEKKLKSDLKKLGITPIIDFDDEEEMKKPSSEITFSDESYILDLARQKETREKELQEEALDDALVLYKSELKKGTPESDKLFLGFVVDCQNTLKKKYKQYWKEQDVRLDDALQAELDRRTNESTMTLETTEIEADKRGNKSQRVSAVLEIGPDESSSSSSSNNDNENKDAASGGGTAKDKDDSSSSSSSSSGSSSGSSSSSSGSSSSSSSSSSGSGSKSSSNKANKSKSKKKKSKTKDDDDDDAPDAGEESQVSEQISEQSLFTVDLAAENAATAAAATQNTETSNDNKEGSGFFNSLFGKKNNKKETGKDEKSNDSKTTTEEETATMAASPSSIKKSTTTTAKEEQPPSQTAISDDDNVMTSLKEMEEGKSKKSDNSLQDGSRSVQSSLAEQRNKRRALFTRIMIVGVVLFFIFDAILLALLFVKDKI